MYGTGSAVPELTRNSMTRLSLQTPKCRYRRMFCRYLQDRSQIAVLRWQAVSGKFAVQRRRVDPQHLGGARLVPPFVLQNPEDVSALDSV